MWQREAARTLGLLVLCTLIQSVAGQQFRGTLTGTVKDNQAAVIPGVRIAATAIDTGARYVTASTATGNYVLPNLAPGIYRVEAEAANFKRYVRERLQIRSNEQTALDIVLEIGQVVETITVSAEAPVFERTGDRRAPDRQHAYERTDAPRAGAVGVRRNSRVRPAVHPAFRQRRTFRILDGGRAESIQ